MVIESSSAEAAPVIPPSSGMSSMSEMPISPTSVASSGHFPFTASEIPGMVVDTSALDTAFQSDVGSSIGLQLPSDGGAGNSKDSLRSLAQIPWNFSLSDLTADLSNLGGDFFFLFLIHTSSSSLIFVCFKEYSNKCGKWSWNGELDQLQALAKSLVSL